MPKLKGSLKNITDKPSTIREVLLRATHTRTNGKTITTSEPVRVIVNESGEFTATIASGAAVLVLIGSDFMARESIPLLVAEGMTTIAEAMEAAVDFTPEVHDRLAELANETLKAVEEASAAGRAASVAQRRAESARDEAGEAQKAAEGARDEASRHAGSAGEAQRAAEKARDEASKHVSAAGEAQKMAEAARDVASGHASTASKAVEEFKSLPDTVSWDGDKLTVGGKQSGSLRGLKGEPGRGGTAYLVETYEGDKPTVDGPDGLAVGSFAKARSRAVAVGSNAEAERNGTVVGYSAEAGPSGTAVGYDAKATGLGSTALGRSANVKDGHNNATAVGAFSKTTAEKQVRVGNDQFDYHVSLAGDVRLTQEPRRDYNATTKAYVDGALADKVSKFELQQLQSTVNSAPKIQVVSNLPDSTDPSIIYVVTG